MKSFRIDKIASAVRNVIGDAILNKLNDPRISPLTSVTRVEMTPDLQIARVFISVMGTDSEVSRTFAGLQHARGHLQRHIARDLNLRHCPELRLELDESIKIAAHMSDLIDASLADPERTEPTDDNDGAME